MADRYLLESGAPDGYLLEDGSGVLLLEDGATGKAKIASFGTIVSHGSDADRGRIAAFALLVSSPLEDRGRIASFTVQVAHTGDEDRGRVAWFGVLVSHTGDEVVAVEVPSAECQCGPGTWLLDLEIGGRILRYATTRTEILDVRGRSYLYRAGLAEFEMTLDGLQEAQGFEVVDPTVGWADLVRRGDALHLARATLRHLEPGQVLEQAMIVLDGAVDEPEYGSPDRPTVLAGTIQADVADVLWPDPRASVSPETWEVDSGGLGPLFDPNIASAVYPVVFGYPGDADSGVSGASQATPALMVRTQFGLPHWLGEFLIADGPVDATSVRLYAAEQAQTLDGSVGIDDYAVTTKTDLLGRTVSTITVPVNDAAITPHVGEEYYVGWSSASGKGGGLLRPDRSGPIRALTDVALYVLRESGRPVDLAAQEAQRDALPYDIDGALNSELRLVSWFESTLMPLFPLVRARSSRGIYWRAVDWGAGPTQAIAHLDADVGRVQRTTSIRTPTDQVRNVWRIDYGFNPRTGANALRRVLGAQAEQVLPWWENPDHLADLRVIGSAICARSQAVFGAREADPIATKFVWSTSTATRILQHLATRDAFPRRSVTYSGDARDLRHLTRGDVVTVTDSEVGLARDVAIVTAVRLSSYRLASVSLEVLDRRVRG